MAVYVYRCGECGRDIEQSAEFGTAARTSRCDECGSVMRLRIGAGVNISAAGFAAKGGIVREVDAREARWQKDMPAYKRMRHRGLQPEQIDGAARLEDKVGDQFDIKYQQVYETGVTRERVQESAEKADQIMREGVPI